MGIILYNIGRRSMDCDEVERCSCESDQATQMEEQALRFAMSAHNAKVAASKTPVSPDGNCIWCHDYPVSFDASFCSKDCLQDRLNALQSKRRSGDI